MKRSAGARNLGGRPRNDPEDVTTQLALRLTKSDREALTELAEEADMPLSTYAIAVLRAHLRSSEERR